MTNHWLVALVALCGILMVRTNASKPAALHSVTSSASTTASSTSSALTFDPMISLLRSLQPFPDPRFDIKITNLSVHRIKYFDSQQQQKLEEMDEDAAAAYLQSQHEVSTLVVTWDDHALVVAAKEALAIQEDHDEFPYEYELQSWVNEWKHIFSPWSPRYVYSTAQSFALVGDLPLEKELSFRVRLVRKQRAGFFATVFSPPGVGPWSEEVQLSPQQEDALEATLSFLVANKPFLLFMTSCIGLGVCVVVHLWLMHGINFVKSHRKRASSSAAMTSSFREDSPKARRISEVIKEFVDESPDSVQTEVETLEVEVRNLRQELADSEQEVRRLMLLRGYGIEELTQEELEVLECELKSALRRVQRQLRTGEDKCGR